MTTRKTLLTAEDVAAMPERINGHRYELHRGEIVEMAAANFVHGYFMLRIGELLSRFVYAHRLGAVIGGDPGITTERNPDTVLAPDVAFFSTARLPRPIPRRGFTEAIPDLVVEVASPDDRAGAIERKTQRWLAAGARIVWNVYPDRRTVEAAYADGQRRIYKEGETLDAEPLLPGFTVAIDELFDLPFETE
jgi:Uma2 family endonuclease